MNVFLLAPTSTNCLMATNTTPNGLSYFFLRALILRESAVFEAIIFRGSTTESLCPQLKQKREIHCNEASHFVLFHIQKSYNHNPPEKLMNRILLDQDVKPLSEFRANSASFIAQIKKSKRPLLLTQHGKRTAVLLDVQEYERILEEIEVLRDINVAREELTQGKGIPHDEFKKRILKKFQAK